MADLEINDQYDFFKEVRIDENGALIVNGAFIQEANDTIKHFKYNPITDQLEADRSIITILNTFSLSNVHDMTSIGENVIFRNNASKIAWSPTWVGIKEQHIAANQDKSGIIQANGRNYDDLYLLKQGVGAATSGSIPYESTSILTSSSGIWSIKATVSDSVLDTDYLFYEIYYGTDETGKKAYEQMLTGVSFAAGEELYSLDPNDNVTPLDRWFFTHQAEFHIGTELYFRMSKADSRDGVRSLLNVRPDTAVPTNYYVEVHLRDFLDLDLEFISPFIGYEGLNFATDDTNTNIIFYDYLTNEALKPFFINELKAIDNGNGGIEIYIKDGIKTYVKDLDITKTYIDTVLVSSFLADAVNELNSLFSNTGTSSGAVPIITSSMAVSVVQGESINYTITGDFGSEVIWDFSNATSVTSTSGNNWNIIGGDSLIEGTYNVPVILLNSNGSDSDTLVITVSSPPYSNTKAIKVNKNDYLDASATTSNPLYRSTNGSGSADAWSISTWFDGGTNNNKEQTILGFGGNDENNEGSVWLHWNASSGNKRIQLRFGTSNNYLKFKTPVNSLQNGADYKHILVTYDGGTTGQDQGQLNDYYSRFKIFIDGIEQSLDLNHNNDGWSGSIKNEFFRVGEASFGGKHMRNGCLVDELALWDSDESSNIVDIYNGGSTHNLAILTSIPTHFWRMGDGDVYPTIEDNVGSLDFTMFNMVSSDIVNDVP